MKIIIIVFVVIVGFVAVILGMPTQTPEKIEIKEIPSLVDMTYQIVEEFQDDTTWKVYVEPFPEYSHDSITKDVVTNALRSWENVNPNLKFIQISERHNSNVDIMWSTDVIFTSSVISRTDGEKIIHNAMGITNTQTTYYEGYEIIHSEILIDIVDTDCNGNPIFWNKETLTNTIAHEIGHSLGIVNHSSDENHLMYDPDSGINNIEKVSRGLIIPEKISEPFYVGEKEVRDNYELQNDKFKSTLAEYGWSVYDWEYDRKSSSNSIFYNKVNAIVNDLNTAVDESNCFQDGTNKYRP